jgi:hypothetical protein
MTKRFIVTNPNKEKTVKQQVEECIRFVNFYESEGKLAPSKPYKTKAQAESTALKYNENLVKTAVPVNFSTLYLGA